MQRALLSRKWRPSLTAIRHYMYPRPFIAWLQNEHQPQYTQIDNGLTVVTLERDCPNVSIGYYADAGARYENNLENGITHFFEHLAFKSTKTLPHDQLQKKINCLGIKLHAKTSRELVTYTADCLHCNVEDTIRILTDCIFNNSLDPDTISTEKSLIYQEIIEQESDAKMLVFDYLHSTAFQGTGLGNSIVGTTSNLYSFESKKIRQYLSKVLNPCRMCLCAVGNVDHDQIVDYANQCVGNAVPSPCVHTVYRYTGSDVRYRNDAMPKAHIAIALEGPPFSSLDSVVIDLACAYLGGWDLSQRGDDNNSVEVVRRASGGKFCDAYKAFNFKYRDTSLFGVQFVAASLQQEDMLYTLQDIILGMCSTITEGELERAKEELKSKILYDTSSCYGAAVDISSHLLFNCYHWPSLPDRMDLIDKIRVEEFKSKVYEYAFNKCPVIAGIGPTEGLPDYNRIRSGLYWLRM